MLSALLLFRRGDPAAGHGRAADTRGEPLVPIFADVNVAGIDKATGMEEFMRSYGFSAAEVAAFGDGGNDVAMLRAAGVGVAMGNACDEALNAADYVTASVDDDGIAKALAHLGVI